LRRCSERLVRLSCVLNLVSSVVLELLIEITCVVLVLLRRSLAGDDSG
jgi:hypothetical protein